MPVATLEKKRVKIPRRTALITFEGTDYDGIEIRCALDVPMKLYFELQRAQEDEEKAIRIFGDKVLTEWNLEDDDGEPIPANGEGYMEIPPAFATLVLRKWMEAVTQPSPLSESESQGSES